MTVLSVGRKKILYVAHANAGIFALTSTSTRADPQFFRRMMKIGVFMSNGAIDTVSASMAANLTDR